MASNPLIAQGTLNRLRGSVVIPAFPQLNATAAYLNTAAIGMALQGQTVVMIPTLTGTVTSPEPYMMAAVTVNLLKTQGLSDLYKTQWEADARIGDFTVTPDASTLSPFLFKNGAIENVRDMSFAGNDAGMVVVLSGYYLINNNLWDLA